MSASKPFVVVLLTAALISASSDSARADVSDIMANDYVKTDLKMDSRVDADEITSVTKNCIASLSGTVATFAAKEYAVQEAKKIKRPQETASRRLDNLVGSG